MGGRGRGGAGPGIDYRDLFNLSKSQLSQYPSPGSRLTSHWAYAPRYLRVPSALTSMQFFVYMAMAKLEKLEKAGRYHRRILEDAVKTIKESEVS